MDDQQQNMPGGFPGSSKPSFEDPEDIHDFNTHHHEEKHVHFDEDSPIDMSGPPPRDISQDDEVVFIPDPEVPQPGQDINGVKQQDDVRMDSPPPAARDAPDGRFDNHQQTSHEFPPPIAENHHSPPIPPAHQARHQSSPHSHDLHHHQQRSPPSIDDHHRQQHTAPPQQVRPDYPVARPVDLPPRPYGVNPPPFPYAQPHLAGPYDEFGRPIDGPWLEDPGMHGSPLGGPPPWMPPPRHAEFHHSHQQVRRRIPRRVPPLLPVRVAPPVQRQPVQIQVQEQQAPQIQVQHIPAPQSNNNNGNNGNIMGDAMQMMMMNRMMSQQMNAQQMQAAQFGAMINGVNGGGRGGGSEVRAEASCGGSGAGGVNVQNCQNQAIGGGRNGNPVRQRRRRVKKRVPKAKVRGGVKIQVGQPRPIGIPPPPPRINAPLPPPPVESLVADNWQEATIILCLAVVALIYLVASRAGGDGGKKKDPSGASLMARGAS